MRWGHQIRFVPCSKRSTKPHQRTPPSQGGVDGKETKSSSFPIGVIQGHIASPLFFILVLQLLLRRHDAEKDKWVPLIESLIHTLGYADDIDLIEYGDPTGLQRLSHRLSMISKGSEDDTDMRISLRKLKVCMSGNTRNARSQRRRLETCVHTHIHISTVEENSTMLVDCGSTQLNASGVMSLK